MAHGAPGELPASSTTAASLGSRYYFTGKPCSHGHVSLRYTVGRSCVQCVNRKAMERYWADPEAHHERARRWTNANRERVRQLTRERLRRYRAADPDRFREYMRQFRANNPHIHRTANRNRKARIRGAGGRHTAADVLRILKLQRNRCAECGASIRAQKDRHVDHILPVSLGGSNAASNIQLLCVSCNLTKAAKHPIDFARERGRLL